MNNKKEIWKDIPNYEGMYQASSFGNIRSLDRLVKRKIFFTSIVYGKKLIPFNQSGYLKVCLCNQNVKKFYIHRLVALTFINNHEGKKCINHKDGIKTNNNLSNLEWVTHSENEYHSVLILNKYKKWKQK